jgi:hypothetical protein
MPIFRRSFVDMREVVCPEDAGNCHTCGAVTDSTGVGEEEDDDLVEGRNFGGNRNDDDRTGVLGVEWVWRVEACERVKSCAVERMGRSSPVSVDVVNDL